MKRVSLLGGLAVWAVAGLVASAPAQVSVNLTIPQESVLLYEPLLAEISLRNLSGQAIRLGEDPERPWLSFLVTDAAGRVVSALEDVGGREQILLRPGATIRRSIDLLPLYDIRAPGTYRVRAMVEAGATRTQSAPGRMIILAGNTVWSQTVGLPAAEGKDAATRSYALIVKHGGPHQRLYCRIADDEAGLIHGMLPLGTFVPMGEPQASTDRNGHLHVLFRSGSRAFQYREINPQGEFGEQAGYSNLQSDPELVMYANGVIRVRGGEQIYPRRDPAPGPAPSSTLKEEGPPPKRWWQFWRQ